jgi:hypothetical protein
VIHSFIQILLTLQTLVIIYLLLYVRICIS